MQPEFNHEGWVLDFYDRVQDSRLKKFMDDLPDQSYFCAVDKGLIERSANRDLHLSGYPNPEKALDNLGVFLMSGSEILCEALAGVEIMGTREIGIDTPEPYQQQGVQTYWNCNKLNLGSVMLARKLVQLGTNSCRDSYPAAQRFKVLRHCQKPETNLRSAILGYQTEKEYRLLVWNKTTS